MEDDDHLFPVATLKTLLSTKYDQITASLRPLNLLLRPLRRSDHAKGYMALLGQHTTAGNVPWEKFTAQFNAMQAYRDIYYIVSLITDQSINQSIVASDSEVVVSENIYNCADSGLI